MRPTMRASTSGTSGLARRTGAGLSVTCIEITPTGEGPLKGGWPHSMW